jgi:hypothetical protein
MDLVLV